MGIPAVLEVLTSEAAISLRRGPRDLRGQNSAAGSLSGHRLARYTSGLEVVVSLVLRRRGLLIL
jgi:hypothetical protein